MTHLVSGARKLAALACALAMIVLPTMSASAQHSPDDAQNGARGNHASADTVWGALDGSVRDTAGNWLHDVEIVTLDNARVRTRSGAGGSFRIDSITVGPHLIRFRRIGILPLTVSVVVAPKMTTSIDAVVEPMTNVLARIVVQAKSGELLHLPGDVAERMHNGMGTYITADEIAAEHPETTADIFRHVAGLNVEGRTGEEVVVSTRGVSMLTMQTDENGGHHVTTGCAAGMNVVLDGADLDTTGPNGTTSGGGVGLIDLISPSDIAAIEIYKDDTESPAALHGSPCGTIYLWTKY